MKIRCNQMSVAIVYYQTNILGHPSSLDILYCISVEFLPEVLGGDSINLLQRTPPLARETELDPLVGYRIAFLAWTWINQHLFLLCLCHTVQTDVNC